MGSRLDLTSVLYQAETTWSVWWGYCRFDHHGPDPMHLMFDEVVSKHLPKSVMLGPDSWLTGEETGFASYPLYYAVNTTDGTRHGREIPSEDPDTPASVANGLSNGRGQFFKSYETLFFWLLHVLLAVGLRHDDELTSTCG